MATATASQERKSRPVNHSLRVKLALWKLDVAIAALTANKEPPTPLTVNAALSYKKAEPEFDDTVMAIYNSCCLHGTPLRKSIDRLGYQYYELLQLPEIRKGGRKRDMESFTTQVDINDIDDLLQSIPATALDFITFEINMRSLVHRLMPNEEQLAKNAIQSATAGIQRGTLSNHVFNLVKLGRAQDNEANKTGIIRLINNQFLLLAALKSDKIEAVDLRKTLKVVQWIPPDIETAAKLYTSSVELLAAAYG